MIKLLEMEVNKHYVIACRASSKSYFFEDASEIRLFENLFEAFLNGICKLKKILFTSKGYIMLIKIENKDSILKAFNKLKLRSSKRKTQVNDMNVWKIISEHFRYLGCTYVKVKNSRNGRQGSLFCRNYERYSIRKGEIEFFEKILELGFINLEQKINKYKLKNNFVFRKNRDLTGSENYKKEIVKSNGLFSKEYYLLL